MNAAMHLPIPSFPRCLRVVDGLKARGGRLGTIPS
jgi:hypothetical protein